MSKSFEVYYSIIEKQNKIAELLKAPEMTPERFDDLMKRWKRNNEFLEAEADLIWDRHK